MSNNNTPNHSPSMGMFIPMILLYVLLCVYLFVRGWQALPSTTAVRVAYSTVFTLLAFGYVLGVVFRKAIPLWLSDVIEVLGSTWFIAFLYILIAVVFIDLLRLANHWWHFFPSWITTHYAQAKLIAFFSVLGIVVILFTWGYIRFTHPKVNQLQLAVHKQVEGKKELRIVAVSDLHLGSIIGKGRLQKFVQQINEQQPDIILISGDLFNADLRPVEARHMNEELRQLNAPLGVYAVLGNHEYIGGDVDAAISYLKNAGIHLLRDEVVNIEGINIVGRDDRTNANRKDLRQLTDSLNKQQPMIVLDHQPYNLEDAEACGADLLLCGHTHNGQVWPVSVIVKRMYEVAQGYKQKGSTHVYVSAGLGIWGPPFRIGTQSEMLVATLIFD